ncbi:MAG: carbohydrate kinase family protein [Erysipelotrichales bacterium]|nr:carbohydrate kinase family protein [Erysipelotrichales bacterium]
MKKIACIGSCHTEQDIFTDAEAEKGGRILSKIVTGYGGTLRNTALNLSRIGFPVVYCAKLGNDVDSVNIWNDLMASGVEVIGPAVDLPTPKKTVWIPKDGKSTVFWDKPEEFSFHAEDDLPYETLNECDICVTDVRDNAALLKFFEEVPHPKWILSHYIPEKEVLSHVYGLVINYEDALSLGKPADFERICYRLCSFGPKWIVINMNFQGAYLYTGQNGVNFPTKCQGDGYLNGCYSAFLSGLTASLAICPDIEKALPVALTAQGLTYKCDSLTHPRIGELFRKKTKTEGAN